MIEGTYHWVFDMEQYAGKTEEEVMRLQDCSGLRSLCTFCIGFMQFFHWGYSRFRDIVPIMEKQMERTWNTQ